MKKGPARPPEAEGWSGGSPPPRTHSLRPFFSTCGGCWRAASMGGAGWLGSCLVVRPSASAQGAATQALQRRHSGALCRAKSIQPW